MATSFEVVYGFFLARIEEIEWANEDDTDLLREDWATILTIAVADFLFPRISLEMDFDNEEFVEDLTNAEVQVLATYMKRVWLRRKVTSWRNIQQQYQEKDFRLGSQANHLARLVNFLQYTEKECKLMADNYSRSIEGKPYSYSNLAGGN